VEAAWPALSQAVSELLLAMVEAVQAELPRATKMLTTVFDRERERSLGTYRRQLRRARRDPTYPEFKLQAKNIVRMCSDRDRKSQRVQTVSFFPRLYSVAYSIRPRFVALLEELSRRCARSTPIPGPVKGCGRALEKLILSPGVPAKVKAEGASSLDARHLVDVVRGSLRCPDFTEITFVLELLLQLDVELGDPEKAQAAGINLRKFQIVVIHIKDRFTNPTGGGWADCMINFRFAHDDDTRHVMELQLQHEQMLVVRKEGNAHHQYNKFRSACELLETVGAARNDSFEETEEDQSPLEYMQLQLKQMQQQLNEYKTANQSLTSAVKTTNDKLEQCQASNRSLQVELDSKTCEYEQHNKLLFARLEQLEAERYGIL